MSLVKQPSSFLGKAGMDHRDAKTFIYHRIIKTKRQTQQYPGFTLEQSLIVLFFFFVFCCSWYSTNLFPKSCSYDIPTATKWLSQIQELQIRMIANDLRQNSRYSHVENLKTWRLCATTTWRKQNQTTNRRKQQHLATESKHSHSTTARPKNNLDLLKDSPRKTKSLNIFFSKARNSTNRQKTISTSLKNLKSTKTKP